MLHPYSIATAHLWWQKVCRIMGNTGYIHNSTSSNHKKSNVVPIITRHSSVFPKAFFTPEPSMFIVAINLLVKTLTKEKRQPSNISDHYLLRLLNNTTKWPEQLSLQAEKECLTVFHHHLVHFLNHHQHFYNNIALFRLVLSMDFVWFTNYTPTSDFFLCGAFAQNLEF